MNAMTIGATSRSCPQLGMVSSFSVDELQTVLATRPRTSLRALLLNTALILLTQMLKGPLQKSLRSACRSTRCATCCWSGAGRRSSRRTAGRRWCAAIRWTCAVSSCAWRGWGEGAQLRRLLEAVHRVPLRGRSLQPSRAVPRRGADDHPVAVRRVKELIEWVQRGEYDRIRSGNYPAWPGAPPSVEFQAPWTSTGADSHLSGTHHGRRQRSGARSATG